MEAVLMKRTGTVVVATMLVLAMACGSMNRATPKQWDDKTIEADVRGKIAEAVPSKTFAVSVDVNHGVVTLGGHAANDDDRRKIANAANSVHGVKSVINNIHLQS